MQSGLFRAFIRRTSLRCLCLIVLIATGATAQQNSPVAWQSSSEKTTPKSHGSIFRQFIGDARFLSGQNDFYAIMGGITFGPIIFRKQFRRESPELTELWGKSPLADKIFESGEIVGDAIFPISLSIVAVGIGAVRGSDRTISFGSKMLRAQAINGILTIALKASIDRTRPNGGSYSYPSGHTSSAFTAAGVVYGHYGKTYGIPAFVVATYIGMSRLQENKHYLSDVIAGGLMGGYLGLKIAGRHNADRDTSLSDQGGTKLRLNPSYQPEFRGASISLEF